MWFLVLILGLVSGSFLTSFVVRFRYGRDFVIGRSACNHCQQELLAQDLIPVLSWILLKGRCRFCRKAIHWSYPLTELAMAAVALGLFLLWPFGLESLGQITLFYLVFVVTVLLVGLAIYDLRWYLLPNRIVLFIFCLCIVVLGCRLILGHDFNLWSFLGSCFIGGGIFYLIFLISERYIGGGDIKLGFVLGFFLADWQLAFLMLFGSCVLGVVVTVPFLLLRRQTEDGRSRGSQIPFAPFLILMSLVSFTAGPDIIGWYLNLL